MGSHLVESLLKIGHRVICLVRRESNLQWLKGLPIRLIFGDITDPHSLEEAVNGVDHIYHLAGLTKAHHPLDYFTINYLGTKNLVEACTRCNPNIKRFIFCSSLAAAGPSLNGIPRREKDTCHPVSDYGKSKLQAEDMLKQYTNLLPVTIVRPTAIYGPRDTELLNLLKLMKKGVLPLLGGRYRFVDICYVQDVVNGLILAGENDMAVNQIFFLSSSEIYNWEEIGDIASSLLYKKVRKVSLPETVVDIVVSMMEFSLKLMGGPPSLTRQKVVEMRQKYWICDITKAKTLLGYSPQVRLEDGLRRSIEWYLAHSWL